MKVSKWVDMGQEVEVDVSMEDIRAAISESFVKVTEDRLGEPPYLYDVTAAFNSIGAFLSALTDEHIAMLNLRQRELVHKFLLQGAARFKVATPEAQEVPHA